MGRRPEPPRTLGPYRNGRRWSVEIRLGPRSAPGAREVVLFDTEAEAAAFQQSYTAGLPRAIRARTFDDAITHYQEALIAKGNKPKSYQETIRRLRLFFGPVLSHGLAHLKPSRAVALYLIAQQGRARTTHLNYLAESKSFLSWCQAQRWITANPLERVQPVGVRDQGKAQLTVDETRKLFSTCVEREKLGDAGAVAVLLGVVLGVRSSEIVDRRVRDVDDEGRIFRIERSKTKAGSRALEVPGSLQPMILRLAGKRDPSGWLFAGGRRDGRHGVSWVRHQTRRLCLLAGVPVITAHGLRGTQASLARAAGASAHLVAAALGHSGTRMHEAAYATPEAVAAGQSRRLLTVLDGGNRPSTVKGRKKGNSPSERP